eukprot:TRINITY_DN6013_c0_g1_i1.p1 TRINITY_DN6013_c0_g1~~TRINITY_DN6013_c0_g1_i1.p1  ORF type:complete len:118 (-),score=25.02 TRINITY_DN6013_c0_g1_i1:13-366(-)
MSAVLHEKDYYKIQDSEAQIPIRWTAPETLTHARQSVASDVWSFGIVLWEVFSYGGRPYPGMNNIEATDYVLAGNVMKAPSGCPAEIYSLMVDCWNMKPQERPLFPEILSRIEDMSK